MNSELGSESRPQSDCAHTATAASSGSSHAESSALQSPPPADHFSITLDQMGSSLCCGTLRLRMEVGGEDTRELLWLVHCLGPEHCHLGVIFTPCKAGNKLSAPRIDTRSLPPTPNVIQDALAEGESCRKGSRQDRREGSRVGLGRLGPPPASSVWGSTHSSTPWPHAVPSSLPSSSH